MLSATASEYNEYPQTSPFEIRVEEDDDQHFQINIDSLLKNSENFHKPFDQNNGSLNNTSTLSSHRLTNNNHNMQPPSAPLSTATTRRYTDYVTSSSNYYDDEHEIEEEDSSFRQPDPNNKHVKKRQANKEAAIRSRLKKKAYQDTIETELQSAQAENNKLKLENAALRAENQLLKRYLNYFENLFAKKSGVNKVESKVESETTSNSQSNVVDLEGFKVSSIPVKRDHHANKILEHDPTEVSFVLERGYPDALNGGGPNSSGSKIGLFSIALVMCVCCL